MKVRTSFLLPVVFLFASTALLALDIPKPEVQNYATPEAMRALKKVVVIGPDFSEMELADTSWVPEVRESLQKEIVGTWAWLKAKEPGIPDLSCREGDFGEQLDAAMKDLSAGKKAKRYSGRTGQETEEYLQLRNAAYRKIIAGVGADGVMLVEVLDRPIQMWMSDYAFWDGFAQEADEDDTEDLAKAGLIESEKDPEALSLHVMLFSAQGDLLAEATTGYALVLRMKKASGAGGKPSLDYAMAFADKEFADERALALKTAFGIPAYMILGKEPPKRFK